MTAQMVTLAEFLTARLDEDEAEANRSVTPGWKFGVTADLDMDYIEWQGRRNQREVAAKRRIVGMHGERAISPSCTECGGYTATSDDARGIIHNGYAIPWPCPTLRALASVYADHLDYRQEWT